VVRPVWFVFAVLGGGSKENIRIRGGNGYLKWYRSGENKDENAYTAQPYRDQSRKYNTQQKRASAVQTGDTQPWRGLGASTTRPSRTRRAHRVQRRRGGSCSRTRRRGHRRRRRLRLMLTLRRRPQGRPCRSLGRGGRWAKVAVGVLTPTGLQVGQTTAFDPTNGASAMNNGADVDGVVAGGGWVSSTLGFLMIVLIFL
jgi:hypothetical protein